MNDFGEEKAIIIYEEKLPPEHTKNEAEEEDKIRIWEPLPKRKKNISCRLKEAYTFLALVLAFVALFIVILMIIGILPNEGADVESEKEDLVTVSADTDHTDDVEDSTKQSTAPPLIFNETAFNINYDAVSNFEYSLAMLFDGNSEVKIAIVHSHNSESTAENLSVSEAGEALEKILESSGIKCIHSTNDHDSESRIGAYERMADTVEILKIENKDLLLVIDIHDSDTGTPLSFTVGTGEDYGWLENLKLAIAACAVIDGIETSIRIVPGAIGQNNGLLSLHVGIGGDGFGDKEARAALSAFAMAVIKLCT